MGKIVALGGGVFMGKKEDQMPPEMDHVHQEIIGLTGKRQPNILYIPTACADSEGHTRIFQEYYTKLGARRVEVLRFIREKPTKKEIETKILEADAIYVCGGNTHRTIATWKRYGADKLLKQAHDKGTVMSGHSCGSICWFAYGNSDSFGKKKIFRVSAMGMFNALICPHYDSEPRRQLALKNMMKRTYGMPAIVLDEYAGLEIIDGKYRFLTAKPNAKVRRAYWRNGEYILEELKPREEFQDLKELLRKP